MSSYDIIEIPKEGNSMPREYEHIEQYESEIIKLKEEGYTHREIGEKFGLTKKQIKGFFSRYHRKQAKITAGVTLRKKGRPPKDYVVSEQDKIAELKYILARKEAKIKSLETNGYACKRSPTCGEDKRVSGRMRKQCFGLYRNTICYRL